MLGPPLSRDHRISGTPSEEGGYSCLPRPLWGEGRRGGARSAEVARHQCCPYWQSIADAWGRKGQKGQLKTNCLQLIQPHLTDVHEGSNTHYNNFMDQHGYLNELPGCVQCVLGFGDTGGKERIVRCKGAVMLARWRGAVKWLLTCSKGEDVEEAFLWEVVEEKQEDLLGTHQCFSLCTCDKPGQQEATALTQYTRTSAYPNVLGPTHPCCSL